MLLENEKTAAVCACRLDLGGPELEWSARSSRGLVRPDNEDSWTVRSFSGSGVWLAMVADGIGGYEGGELASALAIEWAADHVQREYDMKSPEELLKEAFLFANGKILEAASGNKGLSQMGTTLTAALVLEAEGLLYVGHVGDSRAYVMSRGQIRQITDDHSITGELIRNGTISEADARKHPGRNLLTMALGSQEDIAVSVYREKLSENDLILLCTDGLTGLVESSEIASILAESSVTEAAQTMVDLSNSRGGHDNVTVVVLWPNSSVLGGDSR